MNIKMKECLVFIRENLNVNMCEVIESPFRLKSLIKLDSNLIEPHIVAHARERFEPERFIARARVSFYSAMISIKMNNNIIPNDLLYRFVDGKFCVLFYNDMNEDKGTRARARAYTFKCNLV